jgi:hypothetical protein
VLRLLGARSWGLYMRVHWKESRIAVGEGSTRRYPGSTIADSCAQLRRPRDRPGPARQPPRDGTGLRPCQLLRWRANANARRAGSRKGQSAKRRGGGTEEMLPLTWPRFSAFAPHALYFIIASSRRSSYNIRSHPAEQHSTYNSDTGQDGGLDAVYCPGGYSTYACGMRWRRGGGCVGEGTMRRAVSACRRPRTR